MLNLLLPEWNLRDLAHSGPEKLLGLLKYRATNTIFEQYRNGHNGGQGGAAYIIDINNCGLRKTPRPERIVEDQQLLFMNDDNYGVEIRLSRLAGNPKVAIQRARQDSLCVQEKVGRTIMERQIATYQIPNTIVGPILQGTIQSNVAKERAEKSADIASEALSKLSLHQEPTKLSLKDLLDTALDHKALIDDQLEICRSESSVFEYLTRM